MYLTQMHLNATRRGAQKLLGSPQVMHAAVQAAFSPNSLEYANGRALWRIDRPDKTTTSLLIVSPIEPDLTHVVEQAGWQTTQAWQTREYGQLLDRLKPGQQWGFRIRANPVRNVRLRDWADTKPVGHVTVKQQEDWLVSRTATHGFQIPDGQQDTAAFSVVGRDRLQFTKGGHKVVLSTVTFEGVLKVVDADLLRAALISGIGRAKAYGCGMLTLAPLPNS